jgi:hypothetical protein
MNCETKMYPPYTRKLMTSCTYDRPRFSVSAPTSPIRPVYDRRIVSVALMEHP